MKKLIIVVVIFCSSLFAQSKIFVCPGIKLGFCFGEFTEWNIGAELSIVMLPNHSNNEERYGIVLNYDKVDDMKRFHIGLEYIKGYYGIDIGPTFGWNENEQYYGMSIIPFGGLFVLPFYNFTYLSNNIIIHEVGTYLKLAIGDPGKIN